VIKITTQTFSQIFYKKLVFSGGEVHIKLDEKYIPDNETIHIDALLTSSELVIELMLLVDALRRSYGSSRKIVLVCPYLPYARQDRAMNPGESLSLRVMCDIINSLKFETVVVWDAHSDVALALLNNVYNIHPVDFVRRIPTINSNPEDTVLVSPDAGALKKVSKIATTLGLRMVRADKTRNVKDGSITGTVVYSEHIGDSDFLIVDDICDGGRTFIELAKELRPLTDGKVNLYVTHGIFSKGLDPVFEVIDDIYVANPFPHVDLSYEGLYKAA
jgi:ribose-phosphate pyrophosphokinase